MPISKIKSSSITADAASTNLNIDANTLFLDATNNRIGIGTTTPSQKLHVNVDSGNVYEQISSGANNVYLGFESARTASVVQSNNALVFDVGSSYTERMRVTSAGKVGIGTTVPDLTLDVYGNAGLNGAANRIMVLQTNNTATEGYGGGIAFGGYYDGTTSRVNDFAGIQGFKENNTAGNYAGALRFTTRVNGGSPTERFRIDSSGNVGIGTTSPVRPLHVISSASPQILMEPSLGSGETSILIGRGYSLSGTIATVGTKSFINCAFEGNDDNAYSAFGYITSAAGNRSQIATNLYFETKSAGASAPAERMRISSAGDVGIGTSSPAYKLHVYDNRADRMAFFFNASTNSSASGLFIEVSADNGATKAAWQTGATLTLSNGNYLASGIVSKLVLNTANGGYNSGAIIHVEGDGGYNLGQLVFSTGWDSSSNATERMRINSAGRVNINSNSNLDVSRLFVQMSSGDNAMSLRSYDSSTSVMMLQFYTAGNTRIGFIQTVSGSSTTYSTSSDYRLKESIAPMTGALVKVAQLKPVTYKWKSNGIDSQGFIAHELAEVVPECVTGAKDEVNADGNPVYQGVDTSFLVATLTAAIQEQQTLITQLTERIAALENK